MIRADGEILGYTIGNDVCSRSIEGENPLYLPQAKVYKGSCALGPCIVPVAEAPREEFEITLKISRDGRAGLRGLDQTALMHRRLAGARDVAVHARRTSRSASCCSPVPR